MLSIMASSKPPSPSGTQTDFLASYGLRESSFFISKETIRKGDGSGSASLGPPVLTCPGILSVCPLTWNFTNRNKIRRKWRLKYLSVRLNQSNFPEWAIREGRRSGFISRKWRGQRVTVKMYLEHCKLQLQAVRGQSLRPPKSAFAFSWRNVLQAFGDLDHLCEILCVKVTYSQRCLKLSYIDWQVIPRQDVMYYRILYNMIVSCGNLRLPNVWHVPTPRTIEIQKYSQYFLLS